MKPSPLSFLSPQRLLGGIALLCLAAVGAALVTQHVFGMLPCPWCILQRAIFLAIAGVCGLALLPLGRLPKVLLAALADLLAVSGLAAALYQNLVASQSASCALTLADRIVGALGLERAVPFLFRIEASCADAAVDLLGLPYEAWSGALYVLISLGCTLAIVRLLRR